MNIFKVKIMREIKFRIWDSIINGMLYNPTLHVHEDVYHGVFNNSNILSVGSDELMQYIGLKDKNGVEIYEGDIVTLHGEIGVVTFNTHNFAGIPGFQVCNKQGKSIEYYYGAAANEDSEVVGNIHENSELLHDIPELLER